MEIACYIPEGYETLVDDAWLRYRAAARFALAFGKGGRRKRTRVDNIRRVVEGTDDLPLQVQADTFEVTRLRLTSPANKIGSATKLPLSPKSLIPVIGGFEFPVLDGDRVILETADPRFRPDEIRPGWLLVHQPHLGEVIVELPTDEPNAVGGSQPSMDSSDTDSPDDKSESPVRIAPPSSVGRQVCVHDRGGEVVPAGDDPDLVRWECHPRCPANKECPNRGVDPKRLFVRYVPLCPVCAVPLTSYAETASGLPTDWRCDNPTCVRFGQTTALASSTAHGWQLTEDAL